MPEREGEERVGKARPMLLWWWWLAAFGIWPLAHPEHTTFTDLMTWADLGLHCLGFAHVVPVVRRRLERAEVTRG